MGNIIDAIIRDNEKTQEEVVEEITSSMEEGEFVLLDAMNVTNIEATAGFFEEEWFRKLSRGAKTLIVANFQQANPYVRLQLKHIFYEILDEDINIHLIIHL